MAPVLESGSVNANTRPLQVFKALIGAVFGDNQVGLIKRLTAHLGGGQRFEAVAVFPCGVRSGADEGQVDLAFRKKRVDFIVGLTLDELNAEARVPANVIQQLAVIDEGLLGRNHGRHGHPQDFLRGRPGIRVGDGDSLREINRLVIGIAPAAGQGRQQRQRYY